MNHILLFFLGMFLLIPTKTTSDNFVYKDTATITTFYLTRHAEKDRSDTSNRNPKLTKEGVERANNIAQLLSEEEIDAVYSTNYIRTVETAKPTANLFNKEIIIYDWNKFDAEKMIQESLGKNVLIVGHSNTTPIVANKLLGTETYTEIDDANFSNFYIVTINSKERSSVLLKIN